MQKIIILIFTLFSFEILATAASEEEIAIANKGLSQLLEACIVEEDGKEVFSHHINIYFLANDEIVVESYEEGDELTSLDFLDKTKQIEGIPVIDKKGFPCAEARELVLEMRSGDPNHTIECSPENQNLVTEVQDLLTPLNKAPKCYKDNFEKFTSEECMKDYACNFLRSLPPTHFLPISLIDKYFPKTSECIGRDQSSCFTEFFHGAVKSVTSLASFLWDDVIVGGSKWAFNKFKSLYKVEDKTSDTQIFASSQSMEELKKDEDNPEGLIKKLYKMAIGLKDSIAKSITHNFGCQKWSGIPHAPTSTCLQPWPGALCASCSEMMNLGCGVLGFAGGEIINSFLLGVPLRLSQAAIKQAKILMRTHEANIIGKGLAQTGNFFKLKNSPTYKAMKDITNYGFQSIGSFAQGGRNAIRTILFSPRLEKTVSKIQDLPLIRGSADEKGFISKSLSNIKEKLSVKSPKDSKINKIYKSGVGAIRKTLKVAAWPIKQYFKVLGDAFVVGSKGRDALKIRNLSLELKEKGRLAGKSAFVHAYNDLSRSSEKVLKAQENFVISHMGNNSKVIAESLKKLNSAELEFKMANDNLLEKISKLKKEHELTSKQADLDLLNASVNAIKENKSMYLAKEQEFRDLLIKFDRKNAVSKINRNYSPQKFAENIPNKKIFYQDVIKELSDKYQIGLTIKTRKELLGALRSSPLSRKDTSLVLSRLEILPIESKDIEKLASYFRYLKSLPVDKRSAAVEEASMLFRKRTPVESKHVYSFRLMSSKLDEYEEADLRARIGVQPKVSDEIKEAVIAEHKKLGTFDEIDKAVKANRVAMDELTYGCRSSSRNEAFNNALKKFGAMTFASSQLSYLGMYGWHTRNTPLDQEWIQQVTYEGFMKVLLTAIIIKTFDNPAGNFASKVYQAYKNTAIISGVDMVVYDSLFSGKDLAAAKLEELKESPDFDEKLKGLTKYIDESTVIERFQKYLTDNYSYAIKKDPLAFESDFSKEELAIIEQDQLELYPTVQDKMLKLILQRIYDQQRGLLNTGSAGADRWISARGWDMMAIPKDILVGMGNFYILCMGANKPKSALAFAFGMDIANRLAFDHLFRSYKFGMAGGRPETSKGDEWWQRKTRNEELEDEDLNKLFDFIKSNYDELSEAVDEP